MLRRLLLVTLAALALASPATAFSKQDPSAFASAGWAMIAYDARGHGVSGAYLGFAGSGSATIGDVTLRLSTLAKPISG